jgi:hypothetical protein
LDNAGAIVSMLPVGRVARNRLPLRQSTHVYDAPLNRGYLMQNIKEAQA